MIDPAKVCLFVPPELKKFKLKLFNRIASHIEKRGGSVVRGDYSAIVKLPDEITPVIGCQPQFRAAIKEWRARGRQWVYWDRGYLRRVFATWLPPAANIEVSYYRWTLNGFQMRSVSDVPADRWLALDLEQEVKPWQRDGSQIVIADTGPEYWDLHADRDWSARLASQLRNYTKRPIVIRKKDSKRPLNEELDGAHCLITHGSIAAVEAVVMGCPVFVSEESAASLVGLTDMTKIETPIYPERSAWFNSLAYHQWNETELASDTLWQMLN